MWVSRNCTLSIAYTFNTLFIMTYLSNWTSTWWTWLAWCTGATYTLIVSWTVTTCWTLEACICCSRTIWKRFRTLTIGNTLDALVIMAEVRVWAIRSWANWSSIWYTRTTLTMSITCTLTIINTGYTLIIVTEQSSRASTRSTGRIYSTIIIWAVVVHRAVTVYETLLTFIIMAKIRSMAITFLCTEGRTLIKAFSMGLTDWIRVLSLTLEILSTLCTLIIWANWGCKWTFSTKIAWLCWYLSCREQK